MCMAISMHLLMMYGILFINNLFSSPLLVFVFYKWYEWYQDTLDIIYTGRKWVGVLKKLVLT